MFLYVCHVGVTLVSGGVCVEQHGVVTLPPRLPLPFAPGAARVGDDKEDEQQRRPDDGEDDLRRHGEAS